jgi:hypothetical protein
VKTALVPVLTRRLRQRESARAGKIFRAKGKKLEKTEGASVDEALKELVRPLQVGIGFHPARRKAFVGLIFRGGPAPVRMRIALTFPSRSTPMLTKEFRENRKRFPHEELAKYRGQWVAFSPDGRRIVASAPTLEALHQRLEAAGEDVQQLPMEGVPGPDDDFSLGSEELRTC